MNVIELLKKDHETVSGLFKTFESAKESEAEEQMERTAAQICEELTAHATVEEELFYPAVEARAGGEDEKAEDSVKEAHEEHALVKQLVGELQGIGPDDEQFEAKVKVLKDLVEHHVEEEEGTLMPRAKKLLSREELDEMGNRVEARKAELRSKSRTSESRMAEDRMSEGRSSAEGGARQASPTREPGRSRPTSSSTASTGRRASSSSSSGGSSARGSSSRSSSSRSSSSRSSSSRASRASRPARRRTRRSS
jgi:hemerythrin superfamily protein